MIRRLWPKTIFGKLVLFFAFAFALFVGSVWVMERRAEEEIAAERNWLRSRGLPAEPADVFRRPAAS
ncbi:MAG TPA: hypothetical protein VNC50_18275, partial [Planctomycetia bacterium]|nr:hypothetical protein [Planctomycetia bacterium]